MDKFTVDLDQVLNDFEYSELTDQYNSTPRVSDSSASVLQNQNVTKHSINNVFHSLNEYVNTSIGSLEIVENNSNDCMGDFSNHKREESINEQKTDYNSIFHIGDISTIAEDENKSNSQENISEVTDNVNKTDKEQEEPIRNTSVVEAEDILRNENIENHVDLQTELQNVVGNKFGINCEQNVMKPSSENKELKTVIGFEQDLHLDDQEISRLLLELEEDDDLNDQIEEEFQEHTIDTIGCETLKMDENEKSICKGVNIVNTTTPNNVNESINLSGDDGDEAKCKEHTQTEDVVYNENLKSLEIPEETLFDVESSDPVCGTHECSDLIGKVEPSSKVLNSPTKFYDENNAISEVEIYKITNECENGGEIQTIDNNTPFQTIESNNSSQTIEINNSIETIEDKSTCLKEDKMEISLKDTETVPSTDESQLTETSIESCISSSNAVLGDDVKTKELEPELECESVENFQMPRNQSSECLIAEEEPYNSQSIGEIPNINIQKEESAESVSRPDNLPLVIEDADSNRKINLIGDPGSTPYNNLYINNEIGKQDHNSDVESTSSSTSPTFSDASSTASTASTEDIQYKQDLNDPNDTKETPQTSVDFVEAPESSVSVEEAGNSLEPYFDASNDIPVDGTEAIPTPEQRNVPEEQPGNSTERCWLGKEPPLWIPDSEATSCLHCDMKFTMLKRRHHCRACGLVLCSKCCHLRFRLEYLDAEARVCNRCHDILNNESSSGSSSEVSPEGGNSPNHRPNPNNPAEYCSTISPLQQVSSSQQSLPSVMVPVGVLKRKGSNKTKSSKSVMFCDGIRPGSDLTNLDNDFNYNNTITKKLEKNNALAGKINRNLPLIDSETNTFIPKSENSLPPTVVINKSDIKYTECSNNVAIVNTLKNTQLTFAIHLSLYVHVKIINMDCCMNKIAWCFSTEGLINVGQDEIIILLEYIDEESTVPKDIFYHITTIYNDAVKGNSIKELGLSLQNSSNFLDSKNHAGFLYIRPSFQCMENVIKPKDPFLIGILIHRWETPWAKLFPLRLVLRLGAEYRYYPSPLISTRHRDSVYVEIGHTIINILADFRNFSYSLPQIRGLTIHMEEKITTVNIPVNRYDQIIKSLNNSSDHILAFAGNFSSQADSHLVCIQDTQGNENCYSTHAINIHNKPRKITGASFIVFNGALKTSSGLTAKSNIIEDGFMIQVLPEHLKQIRDNLRAMKNHTISCGCVDNVSDETVQIIWNENDTNFNVGVLSAIDGMPLTGVPSIRVHNGKNYICHNGSRIIRWTEVFIIQNGEDNPKSQDPVDISRVSESIAKATCDALVKYLDLLVANNFLKIGIRVTLHVDNVSYCAGSNNTKLPPIYMKSLDNELIPVLHRITSNNFGENSIVLESIFRILNM